MSHYAVINPATGDTIRTYPQISDNEVEQVIASADEAHFGWSRNSSTDERAALLRKVGDLHEERRDKLAAIIVRAGRKIKRPRHAPIVGWPEKTGRQA